MAKEATISKRRSVWSFTKFIHGSCICFTKSKCAKRNQMNILEFKSLLPKEILELLVENEHA
ncbi:MAG: hypothetical protein AABY15_09255 [Nanoarchaeota archaeon]